MILAAWVAASRGNVCGKMGRGFLALFDSREHPLRRNLSEFIGGRRAAFALCYESKLLELQPAHVEIQAVAVRVLKIKANHPDRHRGFVPVGRINGATRGGIGAERHAASRAFQSGRGWPRWNDIVNHHHRDGQRFQRHG